MKVYIVGIGMDGRNTLTREGWKAVTEAELLIGAERMLAPFAELGKETLCSYIPQEIAEALRSCGKDTAAVLMSGDCGFFSGTKKLLPLLGDYDTETVPGISAAAYLCAKTGISYEKMKFVSLHGQNGNTAVNVMMNEYCFFLLGGEMTAAGLCSRLAAYGLPEVTVHIGEELGYEGERIVSGTAGSLRDGSFGRLAAAVVYNPQFIGHIPSAVSDGSFIRGGIPMTKSEVRCIAAAKLDICSDSVVWDIGCGTGSVSVEAAYRCADGKVLAFDRNAEAAELTRKNAAAFGCDNIIVQEGECPAVLAGAEPPDKVFIGGSGGNMKDILEAVYRANPKADIAAAAVSLETLRDTAEAFGQYGAECEVTQIAVTRTERIGAHTMLRAQNPVFIISGRLS